MHCQSPGSLPSAEKQNKAGNWDCVILLIEHHTLIRHHQYLLTVICVFILCIFIACRYSLNHYHKTELFHWHKGIPLCFSDSVRRYTVVLSHITRPSLMTSAVKENYPITLYASFKLVPTIRFLKCKVEYKINASLLNTRSLNAALYFPNYISPSLHSHIFKLVPWASKCTESS